MNIAFSNQWVSMGSIHCDIDDQIDDIEAYARMFYDCSWGQFLADRIKEIADECTTQVESDGFQEMVQFEREDYHPARPMEI